VRAADVDGERARRRCAWRLQRRCWLRAPRCGGALKATCSIALGSLSICYTFGGIGRAIEKPVHAAACVHPRRGQRTIARPDAGKAALLAYSGRQEHDLAAAL